MNKSPDAFRTISEVAELLDTPAHVLRFWESRFPQIKPVKRAGGRRYYRPADMALLAGIRRLLHDEGLTIRGVQKILREQGVRHVSGLSEDEDVTQEIDLEVEDVATKDVTVSSAPIPLFPAQRGKDAPEVVAPSNAGVEDEPAPEAVQDDLDRIDEAALLAAIEGPLEEQKPGLEESQPDNPQYAAPRVSSAPVPPAGQAAGFLPEAPREWAEETGVATPSLTEDAEHTDAGSEKANVALPATDPTDSTPAPDPAPASTVAPPPVPASLEITGHWLPADLRSLRPGAFGAKRAQAEALMQRLEVLRNRVGDLGRVPRR